MSLLASLTLNALTLHSGIGIQATPAGVQVENDLHCLLLDITSIDKTFGPFKCCVLYRLAMQQMHVLSHCMDHK